MLLNWLRTRLMWFSARPSPPLLQATRSIPLVFAQTPDRHVSSLARPGGNATGMKQIEFGMSAKWLEFLKQIAPHVTRVGVLRDVVNLEQGAQIGTLQIIFVLGNAREGHWVRWSAGAACGGLFNAARQAEIEAAPIRYVAEAPGADTDSERAIRSLIGLMVVCCDPLVIALTVQHRHGDQLPSKTTLVLCHE
jgi:hypothetical protein